MSEYLLSCDWGTSFFRLRLIHTPDYTALGEVVSDEGIAATFDAWKQSVESGGLSRDLFFRRRLKKGIDRLAETAPVPLDAVSVVVSGMASSSIGMEEVPYAGLPFAVDGSGCGLRRYEARADFPHRLLLISGVRSDHDVMRGEETQLIGLATLLDLSAADEAVFIFPGTHSKHMYVRDGQLIDFETYMTGEVFHLMATHSILSDSVDAGALTEVSDDSLHAFKRGVQASASSVLNGLFSVRTNQLFGQLDKKQNAFYLSGLLIGTELRPLLEKKSWRLVLCSGSKLAAFYELGLTELRLAGRATVIPAQLVDKAANVGQVVLVQNQKI